MQQLCTIPCFSPLIGYDQQGQIFLQLSAFVTSSTLDDHQRSNYCLFIHIKILEIFVLYKYHYIPFCIYKNVQHFKNYSSTIALMEIYFEVS